MFSQLTESLSKVLSGVVGKKLTEETMRETLREIKRSLLDADCALPAVVDFLKQIRKTYKDMPVEKHLTAAQMLVKCVHQELALLMGSKMEDLRLNAQAPVVILMAGLQGSGKTTTTGKLAKRLKGQGKRVMVTSCDTYRPAAREQLNILAEQLDVSCSFHAELNEPLAIAQRALEDARKSAADILIVDTAGRLHIDAAMMQEMQEIAHCVRPTETLFVVDGMTGQKAAEIAAVFDQHLALTGVICTKLDGDARGGAMLSVFHQVQKPIKFIGTGEKVDGLEPFHPDRMASRILGMGDILSLVEELEQKIDKEQAEKVAKKMQKGKFDLEDFRAQMLQMQQLGGMKHLMEKMPGMSGLSQGAAGLNPDKEMARTLAMINSMTPQERRHPEIISPARKRRIALGSGRDVQDVSRLLKQFEKMQKMMRQFSQKGGIARMMQSLPKNLDLAQIQQMMGRK